MGEMTATKGTNLSLTENLVNKPKLYNPSKGP